LGEENCNLRERKNIVVSSNKVQGQASRWPLLFGLLFLAACSTNKPLNEGFTKIGYTDSLIGDGLHRVAVHGVGGLWGSSTEMERTWNVRSTELCGSNLYTVLDLRESGTLESGMSFMIIGGGVVPYMNSTTIPMLEGYVLCSDSALTVSQAKTFLHEKGLVLIPRELEQIPDNCPLALPSDSLHKVVSYGKAQLNAGNYLEGLACLHLAATDGWFINEGDPDAQYLIGKIYEEGLGVETDLNRAREWYRRALLNGSEEARLRLEEAGGPLSDSVIN